MIIWVLALTSIPFAPSRSKRVGGIFSIYCWNLWNYLNWLKCTVNRQWPRPLPVIFADFFQGLQNWFLRICQLPTCPSRVEAALLKHVVNPPVLMPVAKFIAPDWGDKVDSGIGLAGVNEKENRFIQNGGQIKRDIYHHGPKLISIICHLPDPLVSHWSHYL